jgi:hypothetical protein
VCVCVCVCVCVRARARVRACVRATVRLCGCTPCRSLSLLCVCVCVYTHLAALLRGRTHAGRPQNLATHHQAQGVGRQAPEVILHKLCLKVSQKDVLR